MSQGPFDPARELRRLGRRNLARGRGGGETGASLGGVAVARDRRQDEIGLLAQRRHDRPDQDLNRDPIARERLGDRGAPRLRPVLEKRLAEQGRSVARAAFAAGGIAGLTATPRPTARQPLGLFGRARAP